MKQILGIIISIVLSIQAIVAQRNLNKNWILGEWYSSDPNKGQVVILQFGESAIENLNTIEGPFHVRNGVACVSDKDGRLKAWSNNCSVINGFNDTVRNAYELKKYRDYNYCDYNGGWVFASSVLVLPWPGQEELYQMFYTNEHSDLELAYKYKPFISKLYGGVIDFRSNPKGELTKSWQVLYDDTITVSHLTACRHRNGRDWWICTPMDAKPCYALHTFSDTGYAFHHQQCFPGDRNFGNHDAFGQACFSPDGKYYARYLQIYGIHLFEFDDSTGLFSHPKYIDINIDPNKYADAGVCFSPNSRFLYVAAQNYVYQYDMSEKNIAESGILIDSLDLNTGKTYIADFNQAALGYDGKVYICGAWDSRYLHVINRPNCKGKDCDLVQQAIYLPVLNTEGIPNVPHFINWKAESLDCMINSSHEPADFFSAVRISFYERKLKVILPDELFDTNVELVDLNGKIVDKFNIVKNITIECMDSYSEGIYFVRLSKNGLQKIYKIFII